MVGRILQLDHTRRLGHGEVYALALGCLTLPQGFEARAVDFPDPPATESLVMLLKPRLTLVIGGARSGKSRYAEQLASSIPPPWTYVATAQAFDDEMRLRIVEHQSRRDASWQTVEAPINLADAITAIAKPDHLILIDCLTLWLSNIMLSDLDVATSSDQLIGALKRSPSPIIVVSNEVGLGIVPDTPLGRRFRDAQGWLNQGVAAIADRVVLMTAGIPLIIKDSARSSQQHS